jgi:transposase
MKAKLIKHILVKADEGKYFLFKEDENEFRTQLFHKLSKQNCDEEFAKAMGVVDVEKLAKECAETAHTMDELYENGLFYGFVSGFNKALELIDKLNQAK